MLKRLNLKNVGPAPKMDLDLADRFNLITGDNGLGKSFILDIAWWALTRTWPAEVNSKLTTGKIAKPSRSDNATIQFAYTKEKLESFRYKPKQQAWEREKGGGSHQSLVIYAMADGTFAVWDPARNMYRKRPAYVLNPNQVWDGLRDQKDSWLCNGLIRDWAGWQKEKGLEFKRLKILLEHLSSNKDEPLEPGALTRINLDDVRDIPTIRMPYDQEVPIMHTSSGVRRILNLAYILVWTWEEHRKAAKQIEEQPARNMVFLLDEADAHLHPDWQRRILTSLSSVMKPMSDELKLQFIITTHSPLIMASAEPIFESDKDAWFDLAFEKSQVALKKKVFEKHGTAASWLISDALDLKSGRALEYEALLEQASAIMGQKKPDHSKLEAMNQRLIEALDPKDEFLFRWRHIYQRRVIG